MQALLGATSDASVRDVVWSPDGELLLAASIDGSSRVWRLDFMGNLWFKLQRIWELLKSRHYFGRLTGNASRTIVEEAEDNETLYFSVSEPNSTNETWRRSDKGNTETEKGNMPILSNSWSIVVTVCICVPGGCNRLSFKVYCWSSLAESHISVFDLSYLFISPNSLIQIEAMGASLHASAA